MRELSFERTVPRGLVHRNALGEVYVADSVQTNDSEFMLAIQIPRAHCVWFDRRVPYHDPLATAEAARQGVYVVVHRYTGVPNDVVFSLRRLELRVTDLERYRDRGAPLEGLLTLRLVDHIASSERLGVMTFDGHVEVDGGVAMTVGGELAFLPRDDYTALREYQRRRTSEPCPPPATGPPLDAAASGRLDQRNSVLAEPGDGSPRYPLIVDQRHPAFFDHPYDHLPGPLIVEAYRQAAIVTAHRTGALASPIAALTGCRAAFTAFAELDAGIECSARIAERFDDGDVSVEVGLTQLGNEVASGLIELRPFPDAWAS